MRKRIWIYNCVSILKFWNCFESVEFDCILLFIVSFEIDGSISTKWGIFELCDYCIQWAISWIASVWFNRWCFLVCTWKVPGFSLGRDTGCPCLFFFLLFFWVHRNKPKLVHPIKIPSNSSFTTHPDIRRYIIWSIDSVVVQGGSVGMRLKGWTFRVSNPGGGEIFCTRPDPSNLLYNGHRVSYPGVKPLERGVNHPPLSCAEVKERVELYFYFPSGSSWPDLGWTLPLPFLHVM